MVGLNADCCRGKNIDMLTDEGMVRFVKLLFSKTSPGATSEQSEIFCCYMMFLIPGLNCADT